MPDARIKKKRKLCYLQGILFATPKCLQQPNDLQYLWLHESAYAYGDKLAERKDCNFFYKMTMDPVHEYFKVHW